jgi:hypothetical protein
MSRKSFQSIKQQQEVTGSKNKRVGSSIIKARNAEAAPKDGLVTPSTHGGLAVYIVVTSRKKVKVF